MVARYILVKLKTLNSRNFKCVSHPVVYSLKKVLVHYFRKLPVEKKCSLWICNYHHYQEQYFINNFWNFGIYTFYGFCVMHERRRQPLLFWVFTIWPCHCQRTLRVGRLQSAKYSMLILPTWVKRRYQACTAALGGHTGYCFVFMNKIHEHVFLFFSVSININIFK